MVKGIVAFVPAIKTHFHRPISLPKIADKSHRKCSFTKLLTVPFQEKVVTVVAILAITSV